MSSSRALIQVGSIIRWAGSKRRLLPQLSAFWSTRFTRYVEPFVGSAALFFVLRPSRAVLGDLNPELINALAFLARHPKRVHDTLTFLPKGKRFYQDLRSMEPSGLPQFDRAVRFFYLNRYCFNGLYRTNRAGAFNVPYSAEGTGAFPSLARFRESALLLRRAEVIHSDFQTTVERVVQAGDFVYLDPPFAVSNRRLFHQYGPDTFGLKDLERLRTVLTLIDRRGATFVLSYADSPEARRYLSDWRSKRHFVQRNVAGFGDDRRRSVELIVSNIRDWPDL